MVQALSYCMQCQTEDGLPNLSAVAVARIPDDGVVEATCNKGHRTFIIIQQMKFELLSGMAVRAIADGYYRDSIASFIGALERLFEFFVEATCRKRKVDSANFVSAWNPLGRHSERQLGAFIIAHLLETGREPFLLPRRHIELRNEVIHKGKFPDRVEAVNFGQAVVDCAVPVINLLRSVGYSETVHDLLRERLQDKHKASIEAGGYVSTQFVPTIFSLGTGEVETDVEAAVQASISFKELERVIPAIRAAGEDLLSAFVAGAIPFPPEVEH